MDMLDESNEPDPVETTAEGVVENRALSSAAPTDRHDAPGVPVNNACAIDESDTDTLACGVTDMLDAPVDES